VAEVDSRQDWLIGWLVVWPTRNPGQAGNGEKPGEDGEDGEVGPHGVLVVEAEGVGNGDRTPYRTPLIYVIAVSEFLIFCNVELRHSRI
jgi:hypothetical protein